MTIGAHSYGSTANVAALTPRYVDKVTFLFTTATRPTLATVETQINQISSLANSMLSDAGFVTPITQADVKLAIDAFIDEEVAAIVEGINGSGRFGPTTKEPGQSRYRLIVDDLKLFIQSNRQGFINLGAALLPTTPPTDTTLQVNILQINRGYDLTGRPL
jgi:hypothetical protein